MGFGNLVRYEAFIFVGILMIIGTLVKLVGLYEFSSDWFWFVAGLGLIVEGLISWKKQKQFDNKYKVVSIDEIKKKKKY